MLRIAVLASGGGTDLQSILDGCDSGLIDGKVVAVVSNNRDAFALERARKHGAAAISIDHRGKPREGYERELAAELEKHRPDLIVLAGWLRVLTKYFINKYKNKIINIHPALLPRHGGKGMHGMNVHEAVLRAGDAESGCSVHFVTEAVDGGPVIARMKVPVLPGDTPETLQARVLEAEHRLLPIVVQWFAEGKVDAGNVRTVDVHR
jgi:phosphoribosylglycinamide formyltransferase-1